MAQHVGVHFSAREVCAHQLGVADTLKELGMEVNYWGEPLTVLLNLDAKLLSI